MKTSQALSGKGPPFLGHGKTPLIPPDPYPNPGEGDLVTNIYGGPIIEQWPEDTTKIELLCWHNYRDRPMPKIMPSIEENQKMWHEINLDRMIDYMPVHEIHANDLPDYHFFPSIMNEYDNIPIAKRKEINYDMTDRPRFHKNGVPKCLPHEQIFYVPRLANGRFNWKRNFNQNVDQYKAYCSEDGWNARYLRRAFRPWMAGKSACRQAGLTNCIYFKVREKKYGQRMVRWLKGNFVVAGFVYLPFYCSALAYLGGTIGNYAACYWPTDGPWNPDTMYLGNNARDRGAYHNFI